MGRPATPKTDKTVAAETTPVVKENLTTGVEGTKKEAVEKEVVKENLTTEKKAFPFTIGSDGLVEVLSKKRAGKAVVGVTGKVVEFDNTGCAKVQIEDAIHFSNVPDFSFK